MPEDERRPPRPRSRFRQTGVLARRAQQRRERAEADLAAGRPGDDDETLAALRGGSATPGSKVEWGRLLRPGAGQVIVAIILALFAMAVVMQIRVATQDETYASLRRSDLVQMLDSLTQETRRLESELAELEKTRDELATGQDSERVAREQSHKRLTTMQILAGTVPAEGPGVVIRISDPQGKVGVDVVLNAISEMRDAGAEVIEFNDSIRLVTTSSIAQGPDGLLIDGQPLTTPIKMEVIGDPHALEEGARFRGGLVSEITSPRVGGQVTVTRSERIEINALHEPRENQYAEPVR
ncbi:DUF881 domain-containing protein [Enemella sp. A6]|uniref:DUF881 domain-containing protein n=1 Tax=Enemella sp. A6 TaxID=3440152 RepID=UPI003EB84D87